MPLLAVGSCSDLLGVLLHGQTGSGKTFTMQPLPIRAAADMLMLLAEPRFASVSLWVSCFEIYGGKLFDLLSSRKRLETREDARKRVCIVGLTEYAVEEVCHSEGRRAGDMYLVLHLLTTRELAAYY